MENLRSRFPSLDDMTYLNTPAHGLISTGLASYRKGLMDQFTHQPQQFLEQRDGIIHQARRDIAAFMDADASSTALVPNFSLAFNSLLSLIDTDSTFLLLDGDYPSINFAVQSQGFKYCYAVIDDQLEDNILNAVRENRPDFLCLSVVQYLSGIKIDLGFLRYLKRQFPELVIIADATQYLGVEEFRFRESGIDIIIASCYKWLNAGEGCAVMAFHREVIDQLSNSKLSYDAKAPFTNERGTFIGYFEPGHQDVLAIAGLGFAVRESRHAGIENISRQIQRLSDRAKSEFCDRKLLAPEVISRESHSSIYNLALDAKQFQYLYASKIFCSQRGKGVRVGFHYFNTDQDLNYLLKIIDQF